MDVYVPMSGMGGRAMSPQLTLQQMCLLRLPKAEVDLRVVARLRGLLMKTWQWRGTLM